MLLDGLVLGVELVRGEDEVRWRQTAVAGLEMLCFSVVLCSMPDSFAVRTRCVDGGLRSPVSDGRLVGRPLCRRAACVSRRRVRSSLPLLGARARLLEAFPIHRALGFGASPPAAAERAVASDFEFRPW